MTVELGAAHPRDTARCPLVVGVVEAGRDLGAAIPGLVGAGADVVEVIDVPDRVDRDGEVDVNGSADGRLGARAESVVAAVRSSLGHAPGVPVAVRTAEPRVLAAALGAGASVGCVAGGPPRLDWLEECRSAGAGVVARTIEHPDVLAAGIPPQRLFADVDLLDAPVAASATVAACAGERLVRTTEVRAARRAIDIVAVLASSRDVGPSEGAS